MGLLKEKPKPRPFNKVGTADCITWFTDNNQLELSEVSLSNFEDWLKAHHLSGNLREMYCSSESISEQEMVKGLFYDETNELIYKFLVWAALPEPVEDILISKYAQERKKHFKALDAVKLKKARVNKLL